MGLSPTLNKERKSSVLLSWGFEMDACIPQEFLTDTNNRNWKPRKSDPLGLMGLYLPLDKKNRKNNLNMYGITGLYFHFDPKYQFVNGNRLGN